MESFAITCEICQFSVISKAKKHLFSCFIKLYFINLHRIINLNFIKQVV